MIRRRFPAALLAAAVAAGAAILGPGATASAATTSASLTVAPRDAGVLTAKRPLDVDVEIANTGTAALPAGELAFSLDKNPVASTSTLLDGIEHPKQVLLGYLVTGLDVKTPAVPAGASTVVRARIPADQIASIVSSADGARLLYVRFTAGSGAPTVVAEAAVARMSARSPEVRLGTVIALTAPAGTTGVVDASTQATLTADGGDWAAALDAARSMPTAAIALDPAVLASIRLAGETAPATATRFLDDLEGLPNPVVRLPYADGDLVLQRAAGVTTPLAPTTFAGLSASAVATATGATPGPTASTGSGTASVADLTAWDWSDVRVAWPLARTVATSDLGPLGREGLVLLGGADVADSPGRAAAGPLATVGGTRVLVADATVSPLLATAAGSGTAAAAALAAMTGALATDAVTGSARTVLAVAGRGASPTGLASALDRLAELPWIRGADLDSLAGQTDPAAVELRPGAPAQNRVVTARDLADGERAVERLGSAITDPGPLTGPQRLALIALLSSAWSRDQSGWAAAAGTVGTGFADFTKRVSIRPAGDATPIGADGNLSVVVQNDLSHPVSVDVTATVSNGRLQFTGDSTVRIRVPASASNSRSLAFRSINNGPAQVVLTLRAPDGSVIGTPVDRNVTVRAGFDTIVAVGLLSALGLLLALGVYRNIARRRRVIRR